MTEPTIILGIDPGTFESGWVRYAERKVLAAGVARNEALLAMLHAEHAPTVLAVEMVQAMGMAVGREVFETVWWTGRFTQAWHDPERVLRVFRSQVKSYLCGSSRANDTNIRQALIDAIGPPGTKAKRGPTYGVHSHAWAALAVAVTAEATHLRGYLPTPIERDPVRAEDDVFAEDA